MAELVDDRAAAPAPAGALLSVRVVDPNNPKTQDEDTHCRFQWAAEIVSTVSMHQTMMDYVKSNFTFTCKDSNGFWWFRKEYNIDSRNTDNPRSVSEDREHKYQWAEGSNVSIEDGWNYCGVDTGGVKWYRRLWPEKDPMNPLRVEDDTELRYEWAVINDASEAGCLNMIREGWEYASKNKTTRVSQNWRRKREVPGALPPGVGEPSERADQAVLKQASAKRARSSS